MSKILEKINQIWVIIGITILLILIIEGILTFFYNAEVKKQPDLNAKTMSIISGNPEMFDGFIKEYFQIKTKWVPFVYWRHEPFEGQYINVITDGLRKTWQKKEKKVDKREIYRIFVFGGSAIWGFGCRDDFTIPSQLSKMLANNEKARVEITNFGELGYVSTQEVIALILELKKGNIPDLVVFYDGANDAFSAFQNTQAGIPQNEINRAEGLSLVNDKSFRDNYSRKNLLESITTYKLAKSFNQKLFKENCKENYLPSEELLNEAVDAYTSNIELVDKLGSEYGFKALFYWQPLISYKRKLSPEEELQKNRQLPGNNLFSEMLYSKISYSEKLKKNNNFHDLSKLFQDYLEPYFLDNCHLNEQGNKIISEQIYYDILPILENDTKVKGNNH